MRSTSRDQGLPNRIVGRVIGFPGTLQSGSGGEVRFTRLGAGVYQLMFAKYVSTCVATVEAQDGSRAAVDMVSVAPTRYVVIRTVANNGAIADGNFSFEATLFP